VTVYKGSIYVFTRANPCNNSLEAFVFRFTLCQHFAILLCLLSISSVVLFINCTFNVPVVYFFLATCSVSMKFKNKTINIQMTVRVVFEGSSSNR